MRIGKIERETKETKILVQLDLDGEGKSEINTGIGFFDHMLTLLAFHGNFDLIVKCDGDLEVDTHHTIEDLGIALGTCLKEALGDKLGITRYGAFTIPMDETLVTTNLDISGRPFLVFNVNLTCERVGTFETDHTQGILSKCLKDTKYFCTFQTLSWQKISHKMLSQNYTVLP